MVYKNLRKLSTLYLSLEFEVQKSIVQSRDPNRWAWPRWNFFARFAHTVKPSILRILAMPLVWYGHVTRTIKFLLFKLANWTDFFNKGHVMLNKSIAESSYRNSEISYTTKKQYQYLSAYSLAIAMTSHKKEAWPTMPSGSDVIRSHYYPLTSGIDIPPSYWLLAIDVI